MGGKMKPEQYSKAESERRFMALLKSVVNTKPKPLSEIMAKRAKGRKIAKAKASKI